MSNRITAQEACLISYESHEKRMQGEVQGSLKKIYELIRTASEKGVFDIDVPLEICVDGYKNKLCSLLERDGFICRCYHDQIEREDCISVSWRHLKTEHVD